MRLSDSSTPSFHPRLTQQTPTGPERSRPTHRSEENFTGFLFPIALDHLQNPGPRLQNPPPLPSPHISLTSSPPYRPPRPLSSAATHESNLCSLGGRVPSAPRDPRLRVPHPPPLRSLTCVLGSVRAASFLSLKLTIWKIKVLTTERIQAPGQERHLSFFKMIILLFTINPKRKEESRISIFHCKILKDQNMSPPFLPSNSQSVPFSFSVQSR